MQKKRTQLTLQGAQIIFRCKASFDVFPTYKSLSETYTCTHKKKGNLIVVVKGKRDRNGEYVPTKEEESEGRREIEN